MSKFSINRCVSICGLGVLGLGILVVRRMGTPTRLRGKVAVVTGGSRGLGLELAAKLALEGCRLALAARDAEELERAGQQLLLSGAVRDSSQMLLVPCDLSQKGEATRLIQEASIRFGQVDILVNNAALIHVGPFERQPMAAFRDSMETGYFAMVEAIQSVLPQMLSRRAGSLVNIASVGGKIPVPHLSPYCGTKFAVTGLSETLCTELRPKGVRVTTVYPGLMRTGSFPNALIVGQQEEEYAWFSASSVIPPLAHSARGAARKIVTAMARGQREVSIGWDAAVAAKLHGIAPTLTQIVGEQVTTHVLPASGGSDEPSLGRTVHAPQFKLFRFLASKATKSHNQPTA